MYGENLPNINSGIRSAINSEIPSGDQRRKLASGACKLGPVENTAIESSRMRSGWEHCRREHWRPGWEHSFPELAIHRKQTLACGKVYFMSSNNIFRFRKNDIYAIQWFRVEGWTLARFRFKWSKYNVASRQMRRNQCGQNIVHFATTMRFFWYHSCPTEPHRGNSSNPAPARNPNRMHDVNRAFVYGMFAGHFAVFCNRTTILCIAFQPSFGLRKSCSVERTLLSHGHCIAAAASSILLHAPNHGIDFNDCNKTTFSWGNMSLNKFVQPYRLPTAQIVRHNVASATSRFPMGNWRGITKAIPRNTPAAAPQPHEWFPKKSRATSSLMICWWPPTLDNSFVVSS